MPRATAGVLPRAPAPVRPRINTPALTGLHTRATLVALLGAAAWSCGGAQPAPTATGARAAQGAPRSSGSATEPPRATSEQGPNGGATASGANGFDVAGSAPDGGFNVTASSDLPTPVPSTAQPYARMVESAVAPLRPALAECLRPLGTGRRLFRVVVGLDGALNPRPPQPYEVPPRIATCVEGVLHATTIDPPPPREYPYDIYVSVASQ